jgi:hypothetical protein
MSGAKNEKGIEDRKKKIRLILSEKSACPVGSKNPTEWGVTLLPAIKVFAFKVEKWDSAYYLYERVR